jgi:hypothetical protein
MRVGVSPEEKVTTKGRNTVTSNVPSYSPVYWDLAQTSLPIDPSPTIFLWRSKPQSGMVSIPPAVESPIIGHEFDPVAL